MRYYSDPRHRGWSAKAIREGYIYGDWETEVCDDEPDEEQDDEETGDCDDEEFPDCR